jgi:hypothetical protein
MSKFTIKKGTEDSLPSIYDRQAADCGDPNLDDL